MAKAPKKSDKFHFDAHLILNRWLLSLFGVSSLAELKALLASAEKADFVASDDQSYFFHAITNQLFLTQDSPLTLADLAAYDARLVNYWQQITEQRSQASGEILRPKYFQYLSLLFSEIYLDWYFNRCDELLTALNAELVRYREQRGNQAKDFTDYDTTQLNKIAFWSATGSGKTLLMHVNILQYLHFFAQKSPPLARPDKIIVLTPNESLSRQHLDELKASGFSAVLFEKDKPNQLAMSFGDDAVNIGTQIEIIDVNKLSDKSGDKTVAVDAFEGNNLVLVDEGHRGTSGEQWLLRREALVKGGFAFEYSATLGQAVAGGKTFGEQCQEMMKKKAKLFFNKTLRQLDENQQNKLKLSDEEQAKARTTAVLETYAKSVLFDYSYKHFYQDGYGKESLILNIKKQGFQENLSLYFTAALLSFYQQLYLFEKHHNAIKPWHIEKPLMVFVGNKVADDNSDILEVVRQLALFVNKPDNVKKWLKDLLLDHTQLLNDKNEHIFQGRFEPLLGYADDIDGLYQDMLRKIFHAEHACRLQLIHLKKSDGELALSLGENGKHFAVINIGDASGLLKTAQADFADVFDALSDDFGDGLFAGINHHQSPVNVLIGSRKFTEGWSSWRVSTMGLLNMGKGEGSQIIQLFGRGVRLKGENWSLKRSTPAVRPKGVYLEKLETLNIFGIDADYMDVFRQYLDAEDIQTSDKMLTLAFPTEARLPSVKLKTLQLKDEVKGNRKESFKRQRKDIYLFEMPEDWQGSVKDIQVVLDRYPKVQSLASRGNAITTSQGETRHEAKLDTALFDFFDWDAIYLTLSRFKQQQSWNNLRLDKQRLREFTKDNHWYRLYIPNSALAVDSFSQIHKQQKLLCDLLIEYTKAFYQACKARYESDFYEVVHITADNGLMIGEYQFSLPDTDGSQQHINRLEKLKNSLHKLQNGITDVYGDNGLQMLCFDGHLYAPIFACINKQNLPFTVQPVAVGDESERRFLSDLIAAKDSGKLSEWTQNKDIYLLRNAANKAKGLGFAMAGNFYPDFLLWLVDKETGQQWLSLIDPKGIRNMDLDHAKFGLHEQLQQLAEKLNIRTPLLSAFILSITPQRNLLNVGHLTEQDFAKKHILFIDDHQVYLKQLFKMILGKEE